MSVSLLLKRGVRSVEGGCFKITLKGILKNPLSFASGARGLSSQGYEPESLRQREQASA